MPSPTSTSCVRRHHSHPSPDVPSLHGGRVDTPRQRTRSTSRLGNPSSTPDSTPHTHRSTSRNVPDTFGPSPADRQNRTTPHLRKCQIWHHQPKPPQTPRRAPPHPDRLPGVRPAHPRRVCTPSPTRVRTFRRETLKNPQNPPAFFGDRRLPPAQVDVPPRDASPRTVPLRAASTETRSVAPKWSPAENRPSGRPPRRACGQRDRTDLFGGRRPPVSSSGGRPQIRSPARNPAGHPAKSKMPTPRHRAPFDRSQPPSLHPHTDGRPPHRHHR